MSPLPPPSSLRWLTLHSVALYALAYLTMLLPHEAAHALGYLLAGGRSARLHHAYAVYPHEPTAAFLVGEAAGPALSLGMGFAALWWLRVRPPRAALQYLFVLWLGCVCLTEVAGYLLITPFFPEGDFGTLAEALRVPTALRWVASACGLAGTILVGSRARRPFLALAPDAALLADGRARRAFVLRVAVAPALLGAALVLPFHFPVPVVVSALLPFLDAMFLINTVGDAHKVADAAPAGLAQPEGWRWGWLVALALALALMRALVPGLDLPRV